MADQPIVLTADQVAQVNTVRVGTLIVGVAHTPSIDRPLLPPSGTYAAGGPTRGQLMPVGNR